MTRHPKPRKGGLPYKMAQMEVGDVIWLDHCDPIALMKQVHRPKSQLPEILKDRKFTVSAWTAVMHKRIGQTTVLIRIERVKP